jgi:hypothetical protein
LTLPDLYTALGECPVTTETSPSAGNPSPFYHNLKKGIGGVSTPRLKIVNLTWAILSIVHHTINKKMRKVLTNTAIASNFQTTLIQVVFALANPSAVTTLG